MDAFLLVCELHNLLLRELSSEAGRQFQGLQQAARFYRCQKKLCNNMTKKLVNIDVAFNVMRHLTKPGLQEFANSVLLAISKGTTNNSQRDGASEYAEEAEPKEPFQQDEACEPLPLPQPPLQPQPLPQSQPLTQPQPQPQPQSQMQQQPQQQGKEVELEAESQSAASLPPEGLRRGVVPEPPPDGTPRHRSAAESASLRQEWLCREPEPKAKAPPCRPVMPTSAGHEETAQRFVTLQTLPSAGDDSRRPASQSEDEDVTGSSSSSSCDECVTQGAVEGPADFSCWLAFPKRLVLPWLEKRRARDLWVPGRPKLPWPPLGSFLERTPATWRGDDLEPVPTPTWSKWRWAFVCGLGQRADLNGALVTVSLVDILATLQKPEDRCKVSPLPANYLQTLNFAYDDVGFFPRLVFTETDAVRIRRKNLRIFALTSWWQQMEHVLLRENSEADGTSTQSRG